MKKLFIVIPAIITVTAVIFFSSYKSMNQRHEAYQLKILSARQNLQTIAVLPGKEEWIAFKTESEAKIRKNEIVILELKAKIETSGKKVDPLYIKEITHLEEQLRFEKARLEAFGKSPANWESFKPGFKNEIDEIVKTAKLLTENFGKAIIIADDNTESDAYIAKLSGKN